MTLILLAISLTVALCVIAYNFAIYALPFMVGLTAFQYVHGMDAGFGRGTKGSHVATFLVKKRREMTNED